MTTYSQNSRIPTFAAALRLAALCAFLAPSLLGALSADLSPVVPSPGLVAAPLSLIASSQDGELPVYKFEYRRAGGDWTLLRDFMRYPRIVWSPARQGTYELRVTVLDVGESAGGATASATIPYVIAPRVTVTPAVAATAHPLVALYSMPPCPIGSVRVRFVEAGKLNWNYTGLRSCVAGETQNFQVAGMRPNRTYNMQHEWFLGGSQPLRSGVLQFRTGALPLAFAPFSVTDAADIFTDLNEDVVLSSVTLGGPTPLAANARDLDGNVIWYYYAPPGPNQNAANLLRPVPGGNMLFLLGNGLYDEGYRWQIMRETNLTGYTVRETSVFALNLQLAELGDDLITAIHHELVRMPNGYTAILANTEKVVPSSEGDREMLGDMIIVVDENLQVVWTWNGFDHLDTERRAVLGETCEGTQGGCPQLVNLTGPAEDWMHTNSIDYTPDGNFLLSIRHQDWVIKVNYADGAGDGSILWRLGKDGDFDIIGPGDWPEPSHQHDAEIESNGLLTLFDNGNTRVGENGGNSRGQVYLLNETAKVALLLVNADLGEYSPALGAAELLSNGNYSFSAGAITKVGPAFDTSDMVETNPFGTQVYRNRQTGVAVYRHFRGSGMYDFQELP